MFLFSRISTIAPAKIQEGMQFAAEITAFINANSPLKLSVGSFMFGRSVGTVVWSCVVDSQSAFVAATDKLLANEQYWKRLNAASELFVGNPEDALRAIAAANGAIGPAPFVQTILAVANGDRAAEAMSWGVQMSELVHKITGVPTAFVVDAYGPFGGVGWLSGYADAAAVDAAREKILASTDYHAAMAKSSGFFVPGTGRSALIRNIV